MTPSFVVKGGVVASCRVVTMISGMSAAKPEIQPGQQFPRVRAAIDQKRKENGRFLILGSVSPGLMKQVSEFLTGRIAVVELSPLALNELPNKPMDDLWLMGGCRIMI